MRWLNEAIICLVLISYILSKQNDKCNSERVLISMRSYKCVYISRRRQIVHTYTH